MNIITDYIPLIVSYRNGAAVRLSDLGEVVDSVQDLRNAGLYNGKPSILLIISKQPGANVIQVVDSIKKLLPRLQGTLPPSIKVTTLTDRTTTIRASVKDVEYELILAVVLPAVFVFTGFRFFDFASGVLMTALLAFIGFFAIDGYLSYKVRTRQEEIFHNMPDVLDLLAIIVEAGMGLDAALRKVSEEHVLEKTPLALEIRQIVSEIMVGLPRIEALRNLYKRTGLDDIKALTDIMIQSEKFGTSVSQALKGFAESLRTKRRQIAEETAAKTTIKLVFPLVLCIFPALFIVILGPAVISIYRSFQ